MVASIWSRQNIIDSLISLYDQGIPLRAGEIQAKSSGLHNVIYCKNKGKPVHFQSLTDARNQTAAQLRRQGREQDAERVLSYNERPDPGNKFSAEDVKERRKELIQTLKEKIDSGVSVAYRYQQEHDRTFVSKCIRAFGDYKSTFKAAGLEYQDYCGPLKYNGSHYMNSLIQLIKDRESLDKITVQENHPKLADRLSSSFGGYYNALRLAHEDFVKKGQIEDATYSDPDKWDPFENRKKRTIKRRHQKLSKIVEIDVSQTYGLLELRDVKLDPSVTGREVLAALRSSDRYLSTGEVAQRLNCTPINVTHNLIVNFASDCVRVRSGKSIFYFFHEDVFQKKSTSAGGNQGNTLFNLAKQHNVGYGKVRRILDTLDLGHIVNGERAIGEGEKLALESVLEEEKSRLEYLLSMLQPDKFYRFTDLDIMGCPTSYFVRVQCQEKNYQGQVKGYDVIEYLRNNSDRLRLTQGLPLIARTSGSLQDVSSISRELLLPRSTLLYRLRELNSDHPETCFRIRKSDARSKFLIPSHAKEIIADWENRGEHIFVDLLPLYLPTVSINHVRGFVDEARRVDLRTVASGDNKRLLEILYHLNLYLNTPIDLTGHKIRQDTLRLLHKYMETHNYNSWNLDGRIAIGEIKDHLGDVVELDGVKQLATNLRFSIFRANLGLVKTVMEKGKRALMDKRSLIYETLREGAKDGLLKAIDDFDPGYGTTLGTYAFHKMRAGIQRAVKKIPKSLDAAVGDDAKFMDFIESATEAPDENIVRNDASEKIRRMLEILPDREQEILKHRFGIGVEKKTLEEVGEFWKITRERVRQIEAKAMKKLASLDEARTLFDDYAEA